jgi:polyphosphate kinase
MTRNLDHRVEAITPIYDEDIKLTLKQIIETQWQDNVKARVIDKKLHNKIKKDKIKRNIRSQFDTRRLIEKIYTQ